MGRGGERPPPGAAKIRHASIARPFSQVGRSTLSRATDSWSSGPRGVRVSGRISKAPTRIRRGQTVSARRVRRAISTPLEYIWAHRAKERLWTCLPSVRCNLGLPIGAVKRYRVHTVPGAPTSWDGWHDNRAARWPPSSRRRRWDAVARVERHRDCTIRLRYHHFDPGMSATLA